MTLSFASPTVFWGGANDGVWHLPMAWDTWFLLDSTRAATSGTVYLFEEEEEEEEGEREKRGERGRGGY